MTVCQTLPDSLNRRCHLLLFLHCYDKGQFYLLGFHSHTALTSCNLSVHLLFVLTCYVCVLYFQLRTTQTAQGTNTTSSPTWWRELLRLWFILNFTASKSRASVCVCVCIYGTDWNTLRFTAHQADHTSTFLSTSVFKLYSFQHFTSFYAVLYLLLILFLTSQFLICLVSTLSLWFVKWFFECL